MARTDLSAQRRTVIGLMSLAWIVFSAVGCGGPVRPAVYRVRGQVYWMGKPAAGAIVFFHPISDTPASNENPAKGGPVGRVGEDGSFSVSTYGTNDGAPAGRYQLSLIWHKSIGPGPDDIEDLLPPEFADPRKALLPIVEVRPEENVLPPLRLSN